MPDVLLNNMFTTATLTAAVNKLPVAPGKVGAMKLFAERGIRTTTLIVEESQGRLRLVEDVSRAADPTPVDKNARKRISFPTLHLPLGAVILPDDLLNLTPFGGEAGVGGDPQARAINDKLASLKASIEATKEFHRVGAVLGKILHPDGSVHTDLFAAFSVTKKVIEIDFTNAEEDIRAKVLEGKRHIEEKATGVAVNTVRALTSPAFFDALTGHAKVQKAFEGWQAAQDRLGGDLRHGFTYGGIEFVEYSAVVGGAPFIPVGVAGAFPVAPGVFEGVYAPANYNEAVGTLGLEYYAKAEPRRMGKGWDLEAQSNPFFYCTAPEALVEFKIKPVGGGA